jgi:hypothetical protein
LKGAASKITGKIKEIAKKIGGKLKAGFGKLKAGAGKLKDKFKAGAGKLKDKVKTGAGKFKDKFKAGADKLKNKVKTGVGKLKEKFFGGKNQTEDSSKHGKNKDEKVEKQLRLDKAIALALKYVNQLSGKRVGKIVLTPILQAIRVRYGLKILSPIQQGKNWAIYGAINPEKTVTTNKEIEKEQRREERQRKRRENKIVTIQGVQIRGFRNAGEVVERAGNLRNQLKKLGISDAQIGMRGSAVTGTSSKGGGFRTHGQASGKPSDVDFFIISPTLEAMVEKSKGVMFDKGVLKPDAQGDLDSEKKLGLTKSLDRFAKQTRKQLGRKGSALLIEKSLLGSEDKKSYVLFH